MKKRGKRPEKDKDGTFVVPKPFPCASCNHEHVIQLHDECKVEFNFTPTEFVDKIPDFASIVYKFDPPACIRRMKGLQFELRFGDGNFTGVDLELKPVDQNAHGLWRKTISRFCGWETITVALSEVDPRVILDNLREICFVVTNRHFPNLDRLDGNFEIKNLTFIEK